jgi:thiol-disulfide isomerase/thioredoxin
MAGTEKIIKAKEFGVKNWVDETGKKISPVRLADFTDKFKVIFCFQSWCPGCHSSGFPSLQKMVNALKENKNIQFLAIQTVFEGHSQNTYNKMLEAQKQYKLKIPFGHDAGDDDKSVSAFMKNYKTGGTPWFVFVDKYDNIVFADFHLNPDAAIEILKKQ